MRYEDRSRISKAVELRCDWKYGKRDFPWEVIAPAQSHGATLNGCFALRHTVFVVSLTPRSRRGEILSPAA